MNTDNIDWKKERNRIREIWKLGHREIEPSEIE